MAILLSRARYAFTSHCSKKSNSVCANVDTAIKTRSSGVGQSIANRTYITRAVRAPGVLNVSQNRGSGVQAIVHSSEVPRGDDRSTYVEQVLASPVYDVCHETPLQHAPLLSRSNRANVFLKREDMLPVFSFKVSRCLPLRPWHVDTWLLFTRCMHCLSALRGVIIVWNGRSRLSSECEGLCTRARVIMIDGASTELGLFALVPTRERVSRVLSCYS